MLTLLFWKQKPLLKNAYASFLEAKTFTKKMLTLLFWKQKPLPKNTMKRLMPLTQSDKKRINLRKSM